MTILFFYYPPLLLISVILSFFFPTMMTFFKKSVHSFLGLTPYFDHHTAENNVAFQCQNHRPISTSGGLRFVVNAATGDDDVTQKPSNNINVIGSATVKISSSSSLSTLPSLPSHPMDAKRDPGGIGFIDDVGGGVDGLMSCTESLGFESSDERGAHDRMDDIQMSTSTRDDCDREFYSLERTRDGEARARAKKVGREIRKFPPPLSSFNVNGQPSFYLRPVRKDGRLQLTEVRIQRKEILQASREEGRLRLHLVTDEDVLDFAEREEEKVQEAQEITEHEKEEHEEAIEQEKEGEQELEQEETEKEKKQGQEVEEGKEQEEQGQEVEEGKEQEEQGQEEEDEEEVGLLQVNEELRRVGEWKFPASSCEGISRCYELVNPHHPNLYHPYHSNHHHHLLVWRQHCLTTG